MANHRKRPTPATRMAELMGYEKQRRIRLSKRRGGTGFLSSRDFDDAFDQCWRAMVEERAWPHFTPERRGWREAQQAESIKAELRSAFLDEPQTAFGTFMDLVADRGPGVPPRGHQGSVAA